MKRTPVTQRSVTLDPTKYSPQCDGIHRGNIFVRQDADGEEYRCHCGYVIFTTKLTIAEEQTP